MTVWPDLIASARASSTAAPVTETVEMDAAEPSTLTMKSAAAAVVAERVSL